VANPKSGPDYLVFITKLYIYIYPEARVQFPALPEKKVALERGPLNLVSTTEELLDRNVAAPV
jgi:hypothetical protein